MTLQSSRYFHALSMLLMLSVLGTCPAQAALTVQATSVVLPGVSLHKVDVGLVAGADGRLHLHVRVGRADIKALGWKRVEISLDGTLARGRRDLWYCDGTLTLGGAAGGLLRKPSKFSLILDVGANTLQLDFGGGRNETISLAMPLDQTSHVQMRLTDVPLAWLQGPLSQAWSGRIAAGKVNGTMVMDFSPDGLQGSGTLQVNRAAFDGGSLAAQRLGLKGYLKLHVDKARSQFSLASTLNGGEVLLGPIYAKLPRHAAQLSFTLITGNGSMHLQHLQFADPDALSLHGDLVFGTSGNLHSMSLSRFSAHLPAAYQRYGRTLLESFGLKDLQTSGDLQGSLILASDGLRSLHMRADKVSVFDVAKRFHIQSLDGALDWNRGGRLPATTLAWQGLDFYHIPLGAGISHWRSQDGVLRLVSAVQVPVFGGELGIQRLTWRPAAALSNRMDIAATVTDVDMEQLSRGFGWPRFHGSLAGAMPGLSYENGHMQLQGGLSLHVFDGYLAVTDLSLTHPFGDSPQLAAEIDMNKLNLGEMTDVFDFGKITGTLHGRIGKLRLLDWQLVGFDAHLLADAGGRISQRAINNLASVGGGGIAGGLQGAVLKLFKSFGYNRIGLNCILEGDVCHMSGLKPQGDGYLIVEGVGLPHLTVIGHQQRVSWPVLVSRLQAAINGDGPVVK